jgi:hypothetical protein
VKCLSAILARLLRGWVACNLSAAVHTAEQRFLPSPCPMESAKRQILLMPMPPTSSHLGPWCHGAYAYTHMLWTQTLLHTKHCLNLLAVFEITIPITLCCNPTGTRLDATSSAAKGLADDEASLPSTTSSSSNSSSCPFLAGLPSPPAAGTPWHTRLQQASAPTRGYTMSLMC